MLRCEDETIYTGIASDLERRMQEHFNKEKKCAKYTLTHTAKRLEASWQTENRVLASKLEYHIKRLTKMQKEELIQDDKNLVKFLSDKLDCSVYLRNNNKIIATNN